jgi:hypothetical protein
VRAEPKHARDAPTTGNAATTAPNAAWDFPTFRPEVT